MKLYAKFEYIFLLFIILFSQSESLKAKRYPLLMPDVYPSRDELYLCTPVRINYDKKFYIVGFEPKASMDIVHHMMIFGCPVPGTFDQVWDCGEMAVSSPNSTLKKANPCAQGSHVLYAWARDADPLQLPEDVGFEVGSGTESEYLVLQVHYSKKFPDQLLDNSGTYLFYTEEPRKNLAGVILLGTGGSIKPNAITKMDASCKILENKIIFPFAYRSHTHSLGKVVAGYKVHKDKHNQDHWTLLGKRDPLTPQMFYPVFNTDPIYPGDTLASRCTMESHRSTVTHVGPTNNDEMCNFYLMYFVKEGQPLKMKYCISEGPPFYHWANSENRLNHIPEIESSVL